MMQNNVPPEQGPVVSHAAPAAPTPPPKRPIHRRRKNEGWNNVISTISVLLLAPIIAVFLTAFVFQSYQVDGPSMQATLHNNDRLIVWKLSKTWARITGQTYIPNRGDVVIFTEQALSNYGQDPTKQLIKRVIALPGERVTIKDGIVTVFNKDNPEGFQPDKTLPYGNVITESPGDVDTIVPQNELFVLGDNRANSLDSSEFGPVFAGNVVGKLALRILPLGDAKLF
ncbi:MAG TPA: signal peptidase I [Candidatus Saccharimonadales bacterium]|nr:signal peptidase I [Candidatus Saccharimonadales bacterium]